MDKHTFTTDDIVIHEATGTRGKLISTNQVSAVVEWESADGKTPPDILPVDDINIDVGALAAHEPGSWGKVQTWDELAPADIRTVPDADLAAEIARRELPVPPAGFRPEAYRECWEGGEGCEDDEECPHAEHWNFIGPEHSGATGWSVSTQWIPARGIVYLPWHNTGVWSSSEAEGLSKALETVKREIELAPCVAYARQHPEIASDHMTVPGIAREAEKAGLITIRLLEVVMNIRGFDTADGK